jgi:hypothetical protein
MKRLRVILGAGLTSLVLLGASSTTSVSLGGGNVCTDRCAERFKLAKDACKAIPVKQARKLCEDAAKAGKNDCKRDCR